MCDLCKQNYLVNKYINYVNYLIKRMVELFNIKKSTVDNFSYDATMMQPYNV